MRICSYYPHIFSLAVSYSFISGRAYSYHTQIYADILTPALQGNFPATYKTLQYTATRCNTLQRSVLQDIFATLQHTATHCNTLQHTATHCNTLQHTAAHCNALQRTATHCNTLQCSVQCKICHPLQESLHITN